MHGELDPVGGGDPIPLLKAKLLIGRRNHCDITLDFQNVSSHHCELEFKDGYWFVNDLNSRNGLKVNGIRCRQKYLMPGDILSIARNEYRIRYEPQSTEPPPEVEEDVFSMSLMEKAGLVSRRTDREPPVSPKPKVVPPPTGDSDDDQALRWLVDEE